MLIEPSRLEVWGDPIAHSRSPQLHAAAYAVLGLDWTYGRRRVAASGLTDALASLDATWRGLSLTHPLKTAAFEAAVSHDRRAELSGAANTLLLTPDGPRAFNTDVGGIVRALQEEGIDATDAARIVGAGATATSALIAVAELGARRVEVVARRPEAVGPLAVLGEGLGVVVEAVPLGAAPSSVPLTIATLPGDTALAPEVAADLAETGGLLLDVVYGTWPTPLAAAWEPTGRTAVSGLGMLLHQAVLQIRVFLTGSPDEALPDEDAVLAAMRRAVVGD
ncbi:shikimate dehydrogenase [Microbacterium sp. CJ88]|uniref:shikimate dehydrogenase n=1 Tax=Microbacterium sp. CJ88 TaxID=3445672 RepID=UPI003F654B03